MNFMMNGSPLKARFCLKTYFLLAKPQLSKPNLDIPKLGLGNEEGFETTSACGDDKFRKL